MISCLIYSLFLSLHQITPLHVAAERGHPRIVEFLVSKGADIDIQDKNGVICLTIPTSVYYCLLEFDLVTYIGNNSLERI